jgi:hypothetical protein
MGARDVLLQGFLMAPNLRTQEDKPMNIAWILALCVLHVEGDATVKPPTDELRAQFGLATFYEKHIDAWGVPIVSSRHVSDYALLEARHLIEQMMGERKDILAAMGENGVRYVVMGVGEFTTDIPEHSDLTPARYWDRRARGLGATFSRPAVSCGEENLLCLIGDPYATENILIHEFAHAVHEMGLVTTDPTFDKRLKKIYWGALEEGLWKGTYAASNRMEYWAEVVQSWFDTNRENDNQHNHIDTRAELKEYDPRVAALCEEVFGDGEWRYKKPKERWETPHLEGFNRATAPGFYWPKEIVTAYDAHGEQERRFPRKDGESGVDWERRTAEAGHVENQVKLGWRHREGRGVEASDKLAVAWFRRAVATDDPPAMDHLGWMLREGRGCERDDEEAVSLFQRAAEARHHQARFNLGLMLRDGRGVEAPDTLGALTWLGRAARVGHKGATAAFDELAKKTAPELVAKARALIEAR